jgi:DNA-binding PadR family transcriptional regulator
MRDNKKDQLQGTLDLLVLRILSLGTPMHGFAITERIEQILARRAARRSRLALPGAARMAEAGWVKSSWGVSENNRRARFYAITAAGRRRLAEEETHWAP